MSEKSDEYRVSRDATVMLDDGCRALPDGVKEFLPALVTVHSKADPNAGLEVRLGGYTDSVPRDFQPNSRAKVERGSRASNPSLVYSASGRL